MDSCTAALELALLWHRKKWRMAPNDGTVTVPDRTYPSVAQAAIRAGFKVRYSKYVWSGEYVLEPMPVWDSAKRMTSGMYRPNQFQCLSFHVAKIFGDTQGGAILHGDPEADEYFRLARFDGRRPIDLKDDHISLPAEFTRHCYMSPDVAVRLLNRMQYLPRSNPNQHEEYADISYIR